MLISIIIPTLNEAVRIADTLASIQCQNGPFEIIVADGGSSDDTVLLASSVATVINAPRGRSNQMNTAAATASGDIFLFLHADTHLHDGALQAIRQAIETGYESGIFRLEFDRTSPLLHFYSFCTRFKCTRFCFGDRALFMKRDAFEQVGRFPAIPIFEDLEMAKALSKRSTFIYLKDSVTTAARRFESNGPFRQQLLNTFLWVRYLLGTSPFKLAHFYTYEKKSEPTSAANL